MKLRSFYIVPPDEWLLTQNPDVKAAQVRAHANPAQDERHIEEYVRQWVLRELVHSYHYPAEWLGERLIVEESVQMGVMVKQADISIKNERGRTFLYIETKSASVDGGEYQKAEQQLQSYLSSTHTATVGMVTNGRTTRCFVKKIDPNDFDLIPDIPDYSLGGPRQQTRLVRDITPDMVGQGRKTGLQLIGEKYETILFKCHSVIRDLDGLHDDEALDELCKVLYAKIFDERSTIDAGEGAAFRFQTYGAGNVEEIASNIRELYDEARTKDLTLYTQRIPGYERSRGVFRSQIRLSSNCLARVVETIQAFSIVDTKGDIKGRAFQMVLGPAIRAGMGQYFTPDPVVRLTVGILAPRVTDVIIDPFCGSGHFLTTCLDYVLSKNGTTTEYALHQFRFSHLHGIEKSDRMVRIAMTDMMLHDDGHSNVRCVDALLSFDNYPDIKALADEKKTPSDTGNPEVFDIVVTNPPFGSLMGGEIGNILGRFQLGTGKSSLPLEIVALERCFQLLRPGGKLAIVLQDGVLTDDRHLHVRQWYHANAWLVGVVSLPTHTFTPYGASPKTSVLFLRKLRRGEKPDPAAPVFFGRIDDVGYDATGRPERGSDIDAMVKAFHDAGGWKE